MDAVTQAYSLSRSMDGHRAVTEPISVGGRTHTQMTCQCGERAQVSLPPSKARSQLNRLYQDHLVRIMEARGR